MGSTPLVKKLGITSESTILVINAPQPYANFFTVFPEKVQFVQDGEGGQVDFIHLFVTSFKELDYYFMQAKPRLSKKGMLWISWPKKSSGIAADMDKQSIMSYGLEHGLVDTKVASIDENWSAHKFVYRLKDR